MTTAPRCSLISGGEMDKLIPFITKRGEFLKKISPGGWAIMLFVVLTALFLGITISTIRKKYGSHEDLQPEKQAEYNRDIVISVLVFICIVPTLCLGLYVYKVMSWENQGYSKAFPTNEWMGGAAWGFMFLLIFGGIFTCIGLLFRYTGVELSAGMYAVLTLFPVVLSLGVYMVAKYFLKCQFPTDPAAELKLNCAADQLKNEITAAKMDLESKAKQVEATRNALAGVGSDASPTRLAEAVSKNAALDQVLQSSRKKADENSRKGSDPVNALADALTRISRQSSAQT